MRRDSAALRCRTTTISRPLFPGESEKMSEPVRALVTGSGMIRLATCGDVPGDAFRHEPCRL